MGGRFCNVLEGSIDRARDWVVRTGENPLDGGGRQDGGDFA